MRDSTPRECHGENWHRAESGADSGAVGARDTLVDADLDRLIELWPMLVSDDRAALLAHAEHLVALRGGATPELCEAGMARLGQVTVRVV